LISSPPVPPNTAAPFLETLKVCAPTPIVKLWVTIPAGTVIVTGALLPLWTVNCAELVRSVVTNITSASMSLPLGGPNGSPEHVTPFGVGLYQYTS
jgi:hypothetical protein